MTRILRITLLCLCLLLAYLGTAAAWAGAVFDRLAATLPPAQGMLLSPRQNAILLAVEDPDFATHHGISFADGQGIATITAAVARDLFLSDTRLDGVAGLFQRFYAGVQRCCKAVDIGRDAMALVLNARMPKETQLAYYTSHVYMGTHAGVQVRGLALAALLYESKPLAALDDHAFIRLAAMIKAPKHYHPQHHSAELEERAARIEALLAGTCKPAGWSDTTFDHCRQKAATP
jgi:membrane peptidoglycan carboxypeptidase